MERCLSIPTFRNALAILVLSTNPIAIFSAQVNPIGYAVRHFGADDGLSNSKVTSIFQDQMGWIWIGTNYGLNRYNGQIITSYFYQPEHDDGLPGNNISDICQTSDGTYWVGTKGKGLGCFQYIEGAPHWLNKAQIGDQRALSMNIRAVDESPSGQLLIGSAMGLFIKEKDNWPPKQISKHFLYNMHQLGHDLWMAEAGGMSRLHLHTQVLEKIRLTSSESVVSIHMLDPDTMIYVTRSAVKILEKSGDGWLEAEIPTPQQLLDRVSNTCFLHVNGEIWMALGNELLIFNHELQIIDQYNNGDILNIREDNVTISEMLRDRDGNIWMGTDHGLFQLVPVKQFTDLEILSSHESVGLMRSCIRLDQGLLMAMHNGLFLNTGDGREKLSNLKLRCFVLASDGILYGGAAWESAHGLYIIDTADWSMEYFGNVGGSKYSFGGGAIYDLVEDQEGRIWVGAWDGFQCFDPVEKNFIRFNLPYDDITDMLIMGQDLWVGTLTGGLFKIENIQDIDKPNDFQFTQYIFSRDDQHSLSSDMVCAIAFDLEDNLWIGTEAGLNCYLPEEDKFKRIRRLQKGVRAPVENMFFTLVTDQQNRIWYGTIGQGLGFYDSTTDRFHHFTESDGLPSNNILQNSASVDKQGYIYFGTETKSIVFHPDSILRGDFDAKPLLLERVSCRSNQRGSMDFFRTKRSYGGYVFTARDLDYRFEFACPDFGNPDHLAYEFKLEGLHADWVDNGASGELVFAKLPAGTYSLHAKVTHLMQDWESHAPKIFVKVLPIWYKSDFVRFALVVIFIALLVLGNRYFLAQRRTANERRILKANSESRKKFFRQITHEFQSPLTIMNSVLGQIEGLEDIKSIHLRKLNHSVQELSHLTTQVLSLTKAEAGFSVVRKSWFDLKKVTEGLVASYQSLLEERSVEVRVNGDSLDYLTFMDREKWIHILQNLLLNAIKFSPNEGLVSVELQRDLHQVKLTVIDEGKGIVPTMLPRLFDNFTSTATKDAEGTGLGLSLTNEMVHLFNGNITVNNRSQGGAEFVVILPIESLPSRKINICTTTGPNVEPDLPCLLIVEDHPIVAQMMIESLDQEYRISWESDGLRAMSWAIEQIPDIIITDIILPGEDGYSVCEKIKADFRTNHIPILIVSAKAENLDRIKGWESGTDAYLSKPYSTQELKAVLSRLLKNRKILQNKYQRYLDVSNDIVEKDPFIQQIEEIILNNMMEFAFNTGKLAEHVHLSRVQLYRKLKGLIDMSPSELITEIKMVKAMEKLRTRKYQIAEIAFQVGYKEPSYFTSVFSRYYGCAPSEFLETKNQS